MPDWPREDRRQVQAVRPKARKGLRNHSGTVVGDPIETSKKWRPKAKLEPKKTQ